MEKWQLSLRYHLDDVNDDELHIDGLKDTIQNKNKTIFLFNEISQENKNKIIQFINKYKIEMIDIWYSNDVYNFIHIYEDNINKMKSYVEITNKSLIVFNKISNRNLNLN